MKYTVLIALSSPEGRQNWFSQVINAKNDQGEPLFVYCDCQLICEDCRKLDREQRIQCNHIKQTPPWLSQERTQKWKLISKADPATTLREYAGVIEDDFKPCFPKDLLARMFSNPSTESGHAPKYVFITADPNGGGISRLGVASGYYDENFNFVVSFQSGPMMYSFFADPSKFFIISTMLYLLNGNSMVLSTNSFTLPKNCS